MSVRTKLLKRVWQLYVAHVLLFIIYIVGIGYVAQRWNLPIIIHEFNVAGILDNPTQTLLEGLLLKFKPYNLDVLPLYIILMAVFPFALWCMLRKPDLTMLASIALYFAARFFDWNLAVVSHRQLVLQSVLLADPVHVRRLVRARRRLRRQARASSRARPIVGGEPIWFAAIMTLAGKFPASARCFPSGSIRCSTRTTRRTWRPTA